MENSTKKKDIFFSGAFFVCIKKSHAVLSVIFGILRKNRIGIGGQKIFWMFFFRRKKFRQKMMGFFWSSFLRKSQGFTLGLSNFPYNAL